MLAASVCVLAVALLLVIGMVVLVYPRIRRGMRAELAELVREEADRLLRETLARVGPELGNLMERRLVRNVGEEIVAALPPRRTLEIVLRGVYGPRRENDDVVSAILGGHGAEVGGGGLTISTRTTVHFALRARPGGDTYDHDLLVTHSFGATVREKRFAFFITCDPLLWNNMLQACRLPLYESYFVPDETLFNSVVEEVRRTMEIGITYSASGGRVPREVGPRSVRLEAVPYERWPEFLALFREPVGAAPRLDQANYSGKLRIFECDLGRLATSGQDVDAIESLSLRVTTLLRLEDRFCFWQAPYPCYLECVTFDVSGFERGADRYRFRVVPFLLRSDVRTAQWVPAPALDQLAVRSWLLPGHGLALLWKTDDAPQSKNT